MGGKDLAMKWLLPQTGILTGVYVVYWIAPVLIKKYGGEDWYKYTLVMQLIGPISCILMNFFRPANEE